jgi:CHRD domain
MKHLQLSLTEKARVIQCRLKLVTGALVLACLVLLPTGNVLQAQETSRTPLVSATLSSLNQVRTVLAPSSGRFEMQLTPDATISFSLTYANMSSPVTGAHIHFGASRTNGGVVVFLCGGPKPACPASGIVTGVITAEDVSVLPADNPDSVIPQGITPGDLAGLLQVIRSGDTYVNVHTANFPSGELRGQVKVGEPGTVQ